MRIIDPPNRDAFVLFKRIVKGKEKTRRARLEAIENEMRSHYRLYYLSRHDLKSIPVSTYVNPQKDDLLHCYQSESSNLNRLKAIIDDNIPDEIKGKCLYCLMGSIDGYDHYLPKENFPEFAVNILNLFPCCGKCNSKKHNIWLSHGKRVFVNFYFDAVPQLKYLKVSLRFYNSIPKAIFRLQKPDGMTDDIFELITAHYNKLELLSRFRQNSNAVFSEAKKRIARDCPASTKDQIRIFLMDEAHLWRELIQENYWKVPLYEAMADSAEFIDLCQV